MATEKGPVGELIVQVSNCGSFLTGGLLYDGRDDGRSESSGLGRGEDTVEVQELEQQDEILLG